MSNIYWICWYTFSFYARSNGGSGSHLPLCLQIYVATQSSHNDLATSNIRVSDHSEASFLKQENFCSPRPNDSAEKYEEYQHFHSNVT